LSRRRIATLLAALGAVLGLGPRDEL